MRPFSTSLRFLIPIVVMLLLGFSYAVIEETSRQQHQINAAAFNQVQELSRILTTTEIAVGDEVKAAMALLKQRGNALGPIHPIGTVEVGEVTVPNLVFGNAPQANRYELVDSVTEIMGGTATIFVKSRDNFVRISTNIESEKGVRGVGTFLDPKGKAIQALRKGRAFYGVVDILGTPYITGYEPLTDDQGAVIGAWYVGYKADLNSIKNIVDKSRFLKTGFQAVSDYRNTVRFHSDHLSQSKIEELIRTQPADWQFVYSEIPKWGYKVLTAYPRQEAIAFGFRETLKHFILIALFLTLLFGLIFRQMKQLVYRPLGGDPNVAVALVHRISTGDLTDDGGNAPAGSLIDDLSIMRANLRSMLTTITKNADELKLAATELQKNEQFLHFMIETSPIAVRIAKSGGREIIMANQRYDELLNIEPDKVIGTDPKAYYVHPEDYEDVLRELSEGKQICDRMMELHANDQAVRWVLASYLPVEYKGESVVLGWFYDITSRKQSEDKLTLAARVFAEAHEGITITDANGTIIDVNPTFCEITGYSREEVIGQNPRILSSGRQSPEFYQEMWSALIEKGHWKGEIWNRRKNGELYAELLTISAMQDDSGAIRHYVGLFSDITHDKNQQQALELMAHYDPLTQLPNRVLFADRFQQAISRARRDESLLAVCYLDLDGFKQVNDTLGHAAGDQLLIEVAIRIKSSMREEDTVSRQGGDEFALLMGDIHSLDQCEQALDRIHRAIAQTFMIDNQPVNIAASSGVALYPLDDADPDTLLRHADQAMYQAKFAGRNRYHLFDVSYDQEVQSQRQQLREIEEAFSRNEFCLYYQPKVNMMTGEVLGAEALIRWSHPERGLVPPMEFLPQIEGTTFDIVVGNWVIDQAMQQIDAWNKQGLELQVSVNISPHHLQWPQFVAQLEATLAFHPQIPSHQLQLEVLESSMVSDLKHMSEILRACRDALGVSIALDDFGTGYSSLTYLRHLPANTIKIDQSFVRNMIDDPSDFAIVDGVVGLADAFRREVIAEGVETRDHGLMLLTMGCAMAQGYGIARPMPADAIVDWVKTYRPDAKWEDYRHRPLSSNEAQVLLLFIENTQWVKRITTCVESLPDSHPHWPIMNFDKCHCGRWMTQAKKEQQFDEVLLTTLAIAHEELHQQGTQLYQLHQDGKIEEARAGIEGLTNTQQLIEGILSLLV